MDSLWPYRLYLTSLLCPLDSPGKNTGVGCPPLLQGIFLTQGLNPRLLHCRQILYQRHWGSPEYWGYISLLKFSFSRGICPALELLGHIVVLFLVFFFFFLRNVHTVLYSGYINLYYHQQCKSFLFPTCSTALIVYRFFWWWSFWLVGDDTSL